MSELDGYQAEGHANTWYLQALQDIIKQGDKVTTRGRTTWEVLHAVVRLPDPRNRVLTIPYRRANPFFQALETVWILAGRADAAWITYYNNQLARFLDTWTENLLGPATHICEHFHGAYGERLVKWGQHLKSGKREAKGEWFSTKNQIQDVITQLLAEASSRRAVMAIHNPSWDNPSIPTLDRPCNMAMSYQLRQGRLHAATFNRSNDLNLGLAFTNIVQFTTIQEFIAAALSVEVAHYTHFSSSLHVYHDDPVVHRLMRPMAVVRPKPEGGPDLTSSYTASPYTFDVYRMFGATPMKAWSTTGEGWDVIRVLDVVGAPESCSRLGELEEMVGAISCPYWRSIGWMALAWHALKSETSEPRRDQLPARAAMDLALEYLGDMEAHDWLIACLEYMNRWAANRKLTREFCQLMSQRFGSFERSVEDFILHDGGAV